MNRIENNMKRIRSFRGNPEGCITLQLSDSDVKLIHITPSKFKPSRSYREGKTFHLASHADVTWVGGGWWNVHGTNYTIEISLRTLEKNWYPPAVQLKLPLEEVHKVASKEVRDMYVAKIRAMLAQPR